MRLACALWEDRHPFADYSIFDTVGVVENPKELSTDDVLIVWGGGDIHPSFYKKGRSSMSGANRDPSSRDLAEWNLMKEAAEIKIPIIGVCRGAQMLCALAGGTLIQHIDGHHSYHEVTTIDNQRFSVNSIHHQMMNPTNTEHNIVAWSTYLQSSRYMDVDDSGRDFNNIMEIEPEFIYFPKIKGFAIQWHPEMTPLKNYSQKYIQQYIESHM